MMARNVFNEMRLKKELCDVLLKVDGAEFHAHKIVLCDCSPYFRILFTNGCYPPDKKQYTVPGVSSEIMELILDYAYIQRVNITEENVYELLIAADYLVISRLVNKCSVFLKAHLSQENCIGIWRFARIYFCKNLEQWAFRFILHNFEKVMRSSSLKKCVSEKFLDLKADELCEILENNELNVKEEEVVFDAIMLWIKHAPVDRKTHTSLLLPKLRMGLLKCDFFLNNVGNNDLVADDKACRGIVFKALLAIFRVNPEELIISDIARPRLPSAILLAVGGHNDNGLTNTIEAYDPRAECWVNVTCSHWTPRAYHGTVYLNGFLYCIGGFDLINSLNSVQQFDPITRTWADVSPMHSCRSYLSVCVLDGCIYAIGGFDDTEELNTVERYNPETNQWSMIAPMRERRSNTSATVLNGKVFVCGGFDGTELLVTMECYSPQMDQWTRLAGMTNRRSGVGIVAHSGQIYAVGGTDGLRDMRGIEAYDPVGNFWRLRPEMINPRSNFGIAVLDELLFVVGGNKGITISNKVEYYDEGTAKWQEVEDLRISRQGLSCCVLTGLPNMAEYAAPRDLYQKSQSPQWLPDSF